MALSPIQARATSSGTSSVRSYPRTRQALLEACRRRLAGQNKAAPLVKIDEAKLREAAKSLQGELPSWEFYLPDELQAGRRPDPLDVGYAFFVQCAIQYCFWDQRGGQCEHWREGAASMVKLLNDLYQDGLFPGTHLDAAQVREKLPARMEDMPMKAKRIECLADASRKDDFLRIMKSAKVGNEWRFDTALAARLADAFPTFRDPYLKRAQLALGMFASNLAAKGEKVKLDLTAYADYRVPQVLRHQGIVQYSPALAKKVDGGELLAPDSPEEKAIRDATLVACAELARLGKVSDAAVDAALWKATRDPDFGASAKPFHLTRTTDY